MDGYGKIGLFTTPSIVNEGNAPQHLLKSYREVVVVSANSWKEAVWVMLAVFVLCVMVVIRVYFLPENEQNLLLQPYHRLDASLTNVERPVYQAFLSSENEMIMLWQNSGVWPTVELLDGEGIPPFAADLMPGNLKLYQWSRFDRGPWVDYWGISKLDEPRMPSIILRIINLHADFHPHPHPGKDYDPDQKAAVQIWINSESGARYPGMRLAERDWFWIVSKDDASISFK